MTKAHLHIGRRQAIHGLLREPEEVIRTTANLLSAPTPFREIVAAIVGCEEWNSLELKHFHHIARHYCLAFAGEVGMVPIGIVFNGDTTDGAQAAKSLRSDGHAVVVGLPGRIAAVIESVIRIGFKLRESPPDTNGAGTGTLRLQLGDHEDVSVHLDLAWGDAVEQLKLFTPAGVMQF